MLKQFLIITFCLTSSLFSQSKIVLPSIEEILQQPEDSINIGVASLSLSQEFYPEMKPESFLYAFDYLANRFKYFFGQYNKPEDKISALNTFLYAKGYWNDSTTFDYDYNDLKGQKRKNRFINTYIATKKGTCITMPMLYLILAERLDMPMYAVRAPNHFFVRYIPKNKPKNFFENVEATSGGGYSPDKMYIKDMQIPKKGMQTGMYLRTLKKKEYLASLLLINVDEYIKLKQFDKAQHYAELAMKYDSTLATAIWAYGLVHYHRGWDLKEKMQAEIQNEIVITNMTTKNKQQQTPVKPTSSIPEPTVDSENEFKKYSKGLVPETTKSQQQPKTERVQQNQQIITPELYTEIEMIKERYIPLIEKNLEVWYTLKEKAKERGIAFGTQSKFFERQTNKLKQFKKGDH